MTRKLRLLLLTLGIAFFAQSAGATEPGTLDLKNDVNNPDVMRAASVYRAADLCHIDKQTHDLIHSRLYSWVAYLATGNRSVHCIADKQKDDVCQSAFADIFTLGWACYQYKCDGPPPLQPPDCATLQEMHIGQPGWKVTDGLN